LVRLQQANRNFIHPTGEIAGKRQKADLSKPQKERLAAELDRKIKADRLTVQTIAAGSMNPT
jgi:hypothetical protein